MAHESVKESLRGVAVGLLTPFDDDLEVDHDALTENARALYNQGIRTFLATANISEYHSLSQSECIASAETSVTALPDDATILAGVGGSTKTAIELIEAYNNIGVDAMMIMPPDHTFMHEQGLLQYYEKLAAVTDSPLSPYVRGYDPSVEFLVALTELDAVVGIKYAIEDAHKLSQAVDAGSDDVIWVDGLAEPYAPEFYLAGAEGFSAGVSNFEPAVGLALFEALEAGEYEHAAMLRDITLSYTDFRETRGENNTFPSANSVPAVKKGLDLAGLNGGPVREPLVSLSESDERRAEELYNRLTSDMTELIE